MNRSLARCIVESLRVAGPIEEPLARLRTFGERDWQRTLDWLHLSGLALLFWNHLQDQGCAGAVPPEVAERLTANLADNRLRTAEMAREFDELNHQLHNAGIPYAVLKGFALAPDFCPDASLRNFTDYDYLVPSNCLERARETLQTMGYSQKPGSDSYSVTYYQPSHPPYRVSRIEDIYSVELAREVELHFKVWDEDQRIALSLPNDFLARSTLRRWDQLCFPALRDEDVLIFNALHVFRHILPHWCRVAGLLEIAHFTERRSSDAAFWDRFRHRILPYPRLSQIIGVIFSLAVGVFGVSLPGSIRACTTETLSPVMAMWVERYGLNLALGNFSGNKFSLFLHREFVRDANAWKDIRRRQLFLLKKPARVAGNSKSLRARWAQLVYSMQLLKFHVPATIQYALELPRWKRMVHRTSGCGLTSPR